jgi:hypothetical protein
MVEENKETRGSEFWQIIFPALLGLILIGLICAWVVISGTDNEVTRFAEISTVLLVIPVLIFSVLSLLFLAIFIYALQRLIIAIPPLTKSIFGFVERIRLWVEEFSELVTGPVTGPAALLAGIRNLFSRKRTRYRVE